MYNFYNDMRFFVIKHSSINKKKELTEEEIKNLSPYKNASLELQEDFDGSILGARSMGSKSNNKSLAKRMSSPFGNSMFTTPKPNDYPKEEPISSFKMDIQNFSDDYIDTLIA